MILRRLTRQDRSRTEKAVRKTRQTWFGRVTEIFQGSRLDDQLWEQLEELLISADVGTRSTTMLLSRLEERVRREGATRPDEALALLKEEMVGILSVGAADEWAETDGHPLVLLVVGVNGVGKTTSIAKLAEWHKSGGKKVVIGAADTFRAAAVEQLQAWGARLGVDVIAHKAGADPGAVAFDACQAGRSRKADVVIIDTAGRLHTNFNLMKELKKIQRVVAGQGGGASQKSLLVMDATTGQNGVLQAKAFTEELGCDGVFLAKLDGTAKGGVVLAIAQEFQLPILYIGTGEQACDMAPFDPQDFVEGLFAPVDSG